MNTIREKLQSKTTLLMSTVLAGSLMFAACGGAKQTTTTTSNTTGNSTTTTTETKSTSSSTMTGASAVVKQIYDHAIKRDCASIPPMLTENFRKEVGTSKDMLDALCDSLTDSGKLTGIEVKGEDIKGDSGTVKVTHTFKDGKKEDKDENVKKSADGKWLMDA